MPANQDKPKPDTFDARLGHRGTLRSSPLSSLNSIPKSQMQRHATRHSLEPDKSFIRRTNPIGDIREAHVTLWYVRVLRSDNHVRHVTALIPGANSTGPERTGWRIAAASSRFWRTVRLGVRVPVGNLGPNASHRRSIAAPQGRREFRGLCRSVAFRNSASISLAVLTPSQRHDLKGKNFG